MTILAFVLILIGAAFVTTLLFRLIDLIERPAKHTPRRAHRC
ncbi:MAG: hypothetical protein RRY95_06310 [Oscillospiraceae bacterium]